MHSSSTPNPRSSTRRKRKSSRLTTYDTLESRQLLAALVSFNSGSGELTVDLTDNNDVAVFNVNTGNIEVNGSTDLDSSTAGTQTAAIGDVRRITVNGDITKSDQSVTLNGDFSNDAGASLSTIAIDAVSSIVINGDYQLSNRLDVRQVGVGGAINDGNTGRIRVAGETDIRANNNAILLNNDTNDFAGPVLASNSGQYLMSFADANDINLEAIFASGDLRVSTGGAITDATNAVVSVMGIGQFDGSQVELGNDSGDMIDIGTFQSISSGDVSITEMTSVSLGDISVENLTVNTPVGIFDGRFSQIDVNNTATFNGATRIRVGENGQDTFNAGALTFNSTGHVHVWENSGMNLIGDNTAFSLNLYSLGDITDGDTATINVSMESGFEAANVMLGDTDTDQFNSGALYFYTAGDFDVSEDSSMQITETKNRAMRMFLTSTGAITDALDAQTNIELASRFIAESVNLGETVEDEFNSGSIFFETTGQFRLSEDSSTNIISTNSAGNVEITSAGAITNNYLLDGNGTTITVATVAAFQGTAIDLGNQTNDNLNFGALQFNATGNVSVAEDSSMVLTDSSSAASATLESTGELTDSATATTAVSGTTALIAPSITIGDQVADQFNTQFLNVQSTGAVDLTEDSSINLTGSSRAASMTLVATGDILDDATADTIVTGNLNLNGALLNLGFEATDNLEFGSLTFRSTGNTNITANSDIQLVGNSRSDDLLILDSTGNISDFQQARTEVVNRAIFSGVDVIIGDLVDDCFDILNGGAANLFVNASGTSDVTVECPE